MATEYVNDENAIEYLTGSRTATVTATHLTLKNRLQRLKKERPNEVDLIINQDGSICAHIPVRWIKIHPNRVLSEEEKAERAEIARRVFARNTP